MSWEVKFKRGLWLPQAGWWMDAQSPVERSVVTHAHSDHVARHREVVCSPPTSQLMRIRRPGQRIEHVLPFGRTEPLTTDVAVTLHPAGHILGSSMVEFSGAPGRLLYTGDFKLRRGLAAEACAPPRADVLVMETTFGLPKYEFPPETEVFTDMVRFCQDAVTDGKVPVLYCYSLGKTQEVLCGLAAAGLPIMLHPSAMRLTRIYQKFGVAFPPYSEFDRHEVGGHIVICPPPHQKSGILRHIPAPRTAIVSGWALDSGAIYRFKCDAGFPLSDHADYPDLLAMVEKVQPRRILTLHGYAREFARTLRERGWEAYAIGREDQLDLNLATPAGCN